MGRPSLRERILETGVRTVHELGYAAAGVREITAAAGVPQGSFTNHFRSKEAFGLAVLDRYLEGIEATMAATLGDETRTPAGRLHAYFDIVAGRLSEAGWRYGCLIGNLSLETAEHSDAFRLRLATAMATLTERFAETVRAGQTCGEIRADLPAQDIASGLMFSWQGAMLWMKVHRSGAPIDRFRRVTLASYLTVPAEHRAGSYPLETEQ